MEGKSAALPTLQRSCRETISLKKSIKYNQVQSITTIKDMYQSVNCQQKTSTAAHRWEKHQTSFISPPHLIQNQYGHEYIICTQFVCACACVPNAQLQYTSGLQTVTIKWRLPGTLFPTGVCTRLIVDISIPGQSTAAGNTEIEIRHKYRHFNSEEHR